MRGTGVLHQRDTRRVGPAVATAVLVIAGCATPGRATDAALQSVTGSAAATLQRDGTRLFLLTTTHSFELAQFATKGQTKTVLVEGEVAHRLGVTDDLGAKGDETGTVRITVRPITANGHFGAPLATRQVPGDDIKLESPAGVSIISYGCCQESTAEELLSLASLKTLYVRSESAPLTTYTRLGKPALGRLIAVYLAMTPADQAVLGHDPSIVGVITLTGEDEVLQRMRVRLRGDKPREAALEWSTELGWKTASGAVENHTVIDPARPSAPVYRWKIAEGQAIEIPLVSDRLDLAAAKLPPNVTIEALPLGAAGNPK